MNNIIQFPIRKKGPLDELRNIKAEDITVHRPVEYDCPTCHGTGIPRWPKDVEKGELVDLELCGKCHSGLFGKII